MISKQILFACGATCKTLFSSSFPFSHVRFLFLQQNFFYKLKMVIKVTFKLKRLLIISWNWVSFQIFCCLTVGPKISDGQSDCCKHKLSRCQSAWLLSDGILFSFFYLFYPRIFHSLVKRNLVNKEEIKSWWSHPTEAKNFE